MTWKAVYYIFIKIQVVTTFKHRTSIIKPRTTLQKFIKSTKNHKTIANDNISRYWYSRYITIIIFGCLLFPNLKPALCVLYFKWNGGENCNGFTEIKMKLTFVFNECEIEHTSSVGTKPRYTYIQFICARSCTRLCGKSEIFTLLPFRLVINVIPLKYQVNVVNSSDFKIDYWRVFWSTVNYYKLKSIEYIREYIRVLAHNLNCTLFKKKSLPTMFFFLNQFMSIFNHLTKDFELYMFWVANEVNTSYT